MTNLVLAVALFALASTAAGFPLSNVLVLASAGLATYKVFALTTTAESSNSHPVGVFIAGDASDDGHDAADEHGDEDHYDEDSRA